MVLASNQDQAGTLCQIARMRKFARVIAAYLVLLHFLLRP
jgi:hypothetical protein